MESHAAQRLIPAASFADTSAASAAAAASGLPRRDFVSSAVSSAPAAAAVGGGASSSGGGPLPLQLLAIPGDSPSLSQQAQTGRALKAAGDFALLSGTPLDAAACYQQAYALLAPLEDDCWAAAALQGSAAAALLGPAQEGFLAPYSEVADASPEVAADVGHKLRLALDAFAAASGALRASFTLRMRVYQRCL